MIPILFFGIDYLLIVTVANYMYMQLSELKINVPSSHNYLEIPF